MQWVERGFTGDYSYELSWFDIGTGKKWDVSVSKRENGTRDVTLSRVFATVHEAKRYIRYLYELG